MMYHVDVMHRDKVSQMLNVIFLGATTCKPRLDGPYLRPPFLVSDLVLVFKVDDQ